ncbi:MAG: hypothetical protein AB7O97_14485 [Planctomycetota bacterium]
MHTAIGEGRRYGHEMTRRTTAILLVLSFPLALPGCAGADTAWRQVDAARPWIQVTGTITSIELPDAGDVRIDIEPAPGEESCMAAGQHRLGCIVSAGDRRDMAPVLAKVRVGDQVTVAGYWSARTEGGATRHYVYETTSVRQAR